MDALLLDVDVDADAADAVDRSVTLKNRDLKRHRRRQLHAWSERVRVADGLWRCCGLDVLSIGELHRHCMVHHEAELAHAIESEVARESASQRRLAALREAAASAYREHDNDAPNQSAARDDGVVLLFYRYTALENPAAAVEWVEMLLLEHRMTGKVRIAHEGINGTVAGSSIDAEQVIEALVRDGRFRLCHEDFKRSRGPGRATFRSVGLRVRLVDELVPLRFDAPSTLPTGSAASSRGIHVDEHGVLDTGRHVSPSEFHEMLQRKLSRNTDNSATEHDDLVLVDCRNFYEIRVGTFEGSVAPDVRKYQFFPRYVAEHASTFDGKRVLMFCTGGIRCETGAAVMKQLTAAKEVMQLQGGIHRYLEQYGDRGLFRGVLFVFDDRLAMPMPAASHNHAGNSTTDTNVIAKCFGCGAPHDRYSYCRSKHCKLLVLYCASCLAADDNELAGYCCSACRLANDTSPRSAKEQCLCTMGHDGTRNMETPISAPTSQTPPCMTATTITTTTIHS